MKKNTINKINNGKIEDCFKAPPNLARCQLLALVQRSNRCKLFRHPENASGCLNAIPGPNWLIFCTELEKAPKVVNIQANMQKWPPNRFKDFRLEIAIFFSFF